MVLTVFLALGAWRHVATPRPHPPSARHRDARVGDGALRRQDRHADAEQHVGRELVVDGVGPCRSTTRPLPERFHEHRRVRRPRRRQSTRSTRWTGRSRTSASGTSPTPSTCTTTGRWCRSTRCRSSSSRCRTCGAHRTRADYVIAAKGAPEAIADLCHLDAARARGASTAQVEAATAGGLRVLGVARARFSRPTRSRPSSTTSTSSSSGSSGLHDPVRPGVADAIAECARPASAS